MQVEPPAVVQADAGDDDLPPDLTIEDLPGLEHAGSAESRSCPPSRAWPASPAASTAHPCRAATRREAAGHLLGGAERCGGTAMQTAPQPCASHFRPLPREKVAASGVRRGDVVAALEAPQSMWPRASDPDMAEEVEAGCHGSNVTVVQFDFRRLEFLKPSRMVRSVCMETMHLHMH